MFEAARVGPVIHAEDVWVSFQIRYHRREVTLRETFVRLTERLRRRAEPQKREFWALRGVSLSAKAGDVIGIVGRNGSGKTTFLKTLAGIMGADRGRIEVQGTVGCLLSFGVGFKTNLSGRENVFINASILGLSEREINERLEGIIEFCELGDFIDAPVRTYSSGMRGRLGFAIAINIDPAILILDEVMSTGDVAFQRKAGSVLDRFRSDDKIVLIASHNMEFIRKSCNHAIWLERGEVKASGPPAEVTRAYTGYYAAVSQPRAEKSPRAP